MNEAHAPRLFQLRTPPPPVVTDETRRGRLFAAFEDFRHGGELAKRVYRLGTPTFSDACPTARVRLDADERPLAEFGRKYFDALDADALVFVVLHEALHLAFRHHRRQGRRRTGLWNVACDMVINEYLLQRTGFKKVRRKAFRAFIASAVTFEAMGEKLPPKWFPTRPAQRLALSAEEVYDRLTGRPYHGTTAEQSARAAADLSACDAHAWSDEGPDAPVPGQFESLSADAGRAFGEGNPDWHDAAVGEVRQLQAGRRESLNWDSVLRNRLASVLDPRRPERWAPPPRKTAWAYPGLLLPGEVESDDRLVSILLAVDASGSIDPALLGRLVEIARGVPRDKARVRAISFDTLAYPLDVRADPVQVRGGGGTSFDPIEQAAREAVPYPDLVVVLTDGYAPRPSVAHPRRWFWLLSPGGTDTAITGVGQVCRVEDFVRGERG